MELIRTPTRQEFAQALETWSWIDLGRRAPLFTSLFGDVFLESFDGYWWLDSVAGRLMRPWATIEDLEADLDSAGGQQRFLRAGLALDAELRGLVPGEQEVYGFRVAPIVGGALDVRNLEIMPLTLRLHLTGQLHDRARQAAVERVPSSAVTQPVGRGPGAEPGRGPVGMLGGLLRGERFGRSRGAGRAG